MANKDYWLKFGSGDPRTNSGLTPTFIIFCGPTGVTYPTPGITEPTVGTGAYYFNYGTTTSIFFTVDGGAGLSSGDRYVSGVLDPIQVVDQRMGTTSDSFGSTAVDPQTVLGYLKRNLEWLEGNASFNKSTAEWSVYSRGSSTLLTVKDLTNTTSTATKS